MPTRPVSIHRRIDRIASPFFTTDRATDQQPHSQPPQLPQGNTFLPRIADRAGKFASKDANYVGKSCCMLVYSLACLFVRLIIVRVRMCIYTRAFTCTHACT